MDGHLYSREDTVIRKLYFVLKGFKMFAYAQKGDTDFIEELNLMMLEDVQDSDEEGTGFTLRVNGKEYALQAPTEGEKKQWLDALMGNLSIIKKTKDEKKDQELRERMLREEEERKKREEEERKRREEEERRRQEELKRQEEERKRKEEEERRRKLMEEAKEKGNEIVEKLKKGSNMYKYMFHKGGAPHKRYFALSPDCSRFQWGSKASKLDRDCMITDITHVVMGADSDTFTEAGVSAEEAKKCFSLEIKGRTIDVKAESEEEAKMWYDGMSFLLHGPSFFLSEEEETSN